MKLLTFHLIQNLRRALILNFKKWLFNVQSKQEFWTYVTWLYFQFNAWGQDYAFLHACTSFIY